MPQTIAILAFAFGLAALSGCGQTGPLYLPDAPPPPPPAEQADEASSQGEAIP